MLRCLSLLSLLRPSKRPSKSAQTLPMLSAPVEASKGNFHVLVLCSSFLNIPLNSSEMLACSMMSPASFAISKTNKRSYV